MGDARRIRQAQIVLGLERFGELDGDLAAETVARDPYLLCEEPYLLDFGRADELATVSLGIPEDSALRLEAGILYVLTFNLQAGHTFVPRDKLLPAASRLLGWPEEVKKENFCKLQKSSEFLCFCKSEGFCVSGSKGVTPLVGV